jgi:hypothetical protein
MYYTYNRISREVYDYCITNKLVDSALIAKWKKRGYERLCSTYTINPRNYKFGTVSICRVPKQYLAPGIEIEDPVTGCHGCASGSSANIFGNKYGQYLAAIQIAREERMRKKLEEEEEEESEHEFDQPHDNLSEDEEEDEEEEKRRNSNKALSKRSQDDIPYTGPVGAADGSAGKNNASIWANEDEKIDLDATMYGELDIDAEKEAKMAAKFALKSANSQIKQRGGDHHDDEKYSFKKPRN